MPAEFEVDVPERDHEFDLELSVAIVEGRVTGPDGKPMAGVRVSADTDDRGGRVRGAVRMVIATEDGGEGGLQMFDGAPGAPQARTDDDGRYSLRGVRTGVDLVVRAEAQGLQPAKSEPFSVGDNEVKRNVDLSLATAGKIEVSAFRGGSPASMVVVTAFPDGGSPASPESKVGFAQNGKTTLDGLAPGKWTVQARAVDTGPNAEPSQQTVEVVASQATPVRFDLP
jgi:hypothetical protein